MFKALHNRMIEPKYNWFWNVLLQNKRAYINTAIASLVTNFFVLIIPLFLMSIYDRVLPNQAFTTLWTLVTGVTIFLCFDFILRYYATIMINHISEEADDVISGKMFNHLLSLKMNSKPSSIGAIADYFKEFEMLKDFFNAVVLVSLIDVPFIVFFLIAIAWVGGYIVFVSLFFVILILALSYFMDIPLRKKSHYLLQQAADKHSLLLETFWGLQTIKAINAESLIEEQWKHNNEANKKVHTSIQNWLSFSNGLINWLQQVAMLVLIIVGVYLISDNQLSVGGLIAVSLLNSRTLMLGHLTFVMSRISRAKNMIKNIDKLMNLPVEKPEERILLKPQQILGDIEFQKLTFYYPEQPVSVIDNLSLKINAGEKIGIIGRVGSGKSTMLKLMSGLFSPSSGLILIDHINQVEIDPSILRRHIFYMSPENAVFSGTLRDNLLIAKPDATDEQLLEAVKKAGLEDFVSCHPLGFDAEMGERGENLSLGQRQCLAFARSFLIQPSVLLLDEPTGGIDNKLEQLFIRSIKSSFTDATIVVITHRASLLELVDRIIIVEQGRIIADGPKQQVLDYLKNNN